MVIFLLAFSGILLVLAKFSDKDCEISEYVELKEADTTSLLSKILANKIVFHGQVLDLEGNPVPNAQITYSGFTAAHYENAWTGGGPPDKIKYADENGCFEIRETGGSLFVNCTHPEYYETRGHPEESQRKFGYGLHVGEDPALESKKPAIFRLRKKGIREPLYYSCSKIIGKGQSWIQLPKEGIAINLANGKKAETDTSIYISFHRDKNSEQSEDYDWGYTLRIPEGGFIEKEGRFNFIAPESGYHSEVGIKCKKGDRLWGFWKSYHYFIKFPNKLYGIFEIRVSDGGWIIFQALINPNPASRNLEYEYEKQINKNQGGDGYHYRL